MATYVLLGRWTPQGVAKIDEGPRRLDQVRKLLEDKDATLREFYMLFGPYDFLAIIEAKDDTKLASAVLKIVRQGNATTQTLRAFTEDEYRKVVKSLS
jgi:uncharacterized protein with GYD domain